MEDREIVELYLARNEEALRQTERKYARYCYTVAYNMLGSPEDAEECVNDAYIAAWNSIPPHKPKLLSTFLAKLTRNHALKKLEQQRAEKRGGGKSAEVFEELEEFLHGADGEDELVDRMAVKNALAAFLRGQDAAKKAIFLKRYWYMMSIEEIAADVGAGQSRIKMILLRQRRELKEQLEKEGIRL